jgi:hypothetical protein
MEALAVLAAVLLDIKLLVAQPVRLDKVMQVVLLMLLMAETLVVVEVAVVQAQLVKIYNQFQDNHPTCNDD